MLLKLRKVWLLSTNKILNIPNKVFLSKHPPFRNRKVLQLHTHIWNFKNLNQIKHFKSEKIKIKNLWKNASSWFFREAPNFEISEEEKSQKVVNFHPQTFAHLPRVIFRFNSLWTNLQLRKLIIWLFEEKLNQILIADWS